ncbi:MAG: tRNA lysidine(34) synthetase TilS [Verrucomicrobia bacterium]|nr:tRNA lysidine(34) synthetase TilS [Verrucomicrobiota bacterium]
MSEVIAQIDTAIRRRKLLRAGERVLVAVSGGLDSMVLLHALHQLSRRHGWALTVAHVNHRLRGRSSAADERLVRATARHLRLPCVVGRADVASRARREGLSLEVAARQVRHELLARAARARRIGTVALAHQADDQAELFLLRLLRGAGSDGLAGMKWCHPSPADRRVRLVRPLLHLTREALREFACERGIVYREDASNASMAHARNRVRHELVPWLTRHYQPALGRVLRRQAELLGDEAEYLNGCAEAWLRQPRGAPFDRLPVALQRRVLQRQLIRLGVEPEFDLVETLRERPGTTLQVQPRRHLWRDPGGRLQTRVARAAGFQPGALALEVRARPARAEFSGVRFDWATPRLAGSDRPSSRAGTEWFDADRVGDRIWLRHWRPGDRFQPIGMPSAVKLQDLFTNARVPRDDRRRRIVATTADGAIWWVEGLRIAEGFKLRPDTRRRLRWRWRRRR